jgi:valine--tRNA ligase
LGDVVDLEAEKESARAELDHLRKFLKGIQGKLANERFVSGAPESVVAMERKKEADTLAKIAALEAKL